MANAFCHFIFYIVNCHQVFFTLIPESSHGRVTIYSRRWWHNTYELFGGILYNYTLRKNHADQHNAQGC